MLPPGPAGWIEYPGVAIRSAMLDGKALKVSASRIEIPARDRAQCFEIARGTP
jgi:hypothetical protein